MSQGIKFHLFRQMSDAAIVHGYSAIGAAHRPPTAVWLEKQGGWVVQVWSGVSATPGCINTPWEGTARICVKHTKAKNVAQANSRKYDLPITWDELQSIKEWLFPGRIALEVYPPADKVVDVANLRWLWVLPPSAVLPFNLQSTSMQRLES